MSVNKVFLVGRLGRDPQVRNTPSGQTVASLSLATERRYKDRAGNRQKQTEWHNVVAWGRTAEICGQYLSKGSQVNVIGRLQTRSWEDKKTEEKRYRTEIIVEELTMLGGGRSRPSQGQYSGGGDFNSAPGFEDQGGGDDDDRHRFDNGGDDDTPF